MNQPRQPHDPQTEEGANPVSDSSGIGENGIPDGMEDEKPKGTPTDDRHETETAPKS